MENILEIKDLYKDFGSFKLDHISFALPKGFIMGFIGPNGAGKTTTIKSILGSLKVQSGEIRVLGKNIRDNEAEIKSQLGVVMDKPYFVGEWNLKQVESVIRPFYENWDSHIYHSYLSKFDLAPQMKLVEMSKGMQTKLMIAVALSHDAKLLILDEPTSGLDPVAREELMDILREFISDENRGVLLSSHITSDLEKTADFITFIQGGKLHFTGGKDAFLELYYIIKGGPDEINDAVLKHAIDLRRHETGFSALLPRTRRGEMPPGLVFETPTIEDIMIHIYRGEQ